MALARTTLPSTVDQAWQMSSEGTIQNGVGDTWGQHADMYINLGDGLDAMPVKLQ